MNKQGNLKTLAAFFTLIALVTLPVKADQVYDEKGHYQGHIEDNGRVYDETGRYQGRIEDDRRFDRRGKYWGRYDKRGKHWEKIEKFRQHGNSEREGPYRLDETYDARGRYRD